MTILICCLFAGVQPPLSFFLGNPLMKFVVNISFARWAEEALQIVEVEAYPELYHQTIDSMIGGMLERGWKWDNLWIDQWHLMILGFVMRIIAFFLLKLGNRFRG